MNRNNAYSNSNYSKHTKPIAITRQSIQSRTDTNPDSFPFYESTPPKFYIDKFGDVKIYYQICVYRNTFTNKFNVRKYVIKSNNDIAKIKYMSLMSEQLDKLIQTLKPHEYKKFPNVDFSNIQHVKISDILSLNSNMLNKDHTYSGFAPF